MGNQIGLHGLQSAYIYRFVSHFCPALYNNNPQEYKDLINVTLNQTNGTEIIGWINILQYNQLIPTFTISRVYYVLPTNY